MPDSDHAPNEMPSPARARWERAVRAAREGLGLSLTRFARLAGVTRQTATGWEHSGSFPRAPAFAKILVELKARELTAAFDELLAAAVTAAGCRRRAAP